MCMQGSIEPPREKEREREGERERERERDGDSGAQEMKESEID